MKYFWILFLVLISKTTTVFSQEKFISHKIVSGETISSIAEKYHVSQKVIFDLNPKASGVLKLNSILKIPNKNTKKEKVKNEVVKKEIPLKKKDTKEISYEVLPKETLFGIAKKFDISVDAIKKRNPSIEKQGLQIGKKIILEVSENFQLKEEMLVALPSNPEKNNQHLTENNSINEFVATTEKNEGIQEYEVKASETKYGIAKRYGITVAELDKLNPNSIATSLEVGQKLIVPFQEKSSNPAILIQTEPATAELPATKLSTTELPVVSKPTTETIATGLPVTELPAATKPTTETTTTGLPVTELPNTEKTVIAEKTVTPEVVTDVVPTNEVLIVNTQEANESIVVSHVVKPKETKFGIAKKYGMTIAELEKLNPNIQNKLRVGALLKLKEGVTDVEVKQPESAKETGVVENTIEKFYGNYTIADDLISKASNNIGIRYRSGGTTRAGFDCSGLMYSTFSALDIKLPRSSNEQATIGIRVDPKAAQKGDLIFFKTRGSGRINHVGMVVEVMDDEIKFIHSSTNKGVIISSTKEGYYTRSFAQVNRILK